MCRAGACPRRVNAVVAVLWHGVGKPPPYCTAPKGLSINMNKTLGLYLHVPFCRSKCAYCDFYSVTDHGLAPRYTDALILHMEDYSAGAKNYYVDTAYIGGGTPTVLPRKALLDIIDGIYGNFNVLESAEFTIECNPATTDRGTLSALRHSGVNRLSMGFQSACDNELRNLTRIHTFDEAAA